MIPQVKSTTQLDANKHIGDILNLAIEYTPSHLALIIYDTQCELTKMIAEAYRYCLPNAKFIHFDSIEQSMIMAEFKMLKPLDLVVLIQSTSFRLDAFRIRVELFRLKIKVIEHPHLARMLGIEADWYIDSLAYDAQYYRGIGHALKKRIDGANRAVIDSGGEHLVYASAFESAKLNIGDFTGMANIGSQFPIGEVFTETKNFNAVNGRVRIFAFADSNFRVNKPEKPITLVIEQSKVVEVIDSIEELDIVIDKIRADEDEVWVRELGFGMNRTFTPEKIVSDIGTYERMCGIHLSLGAKHAIYAKPLFNRKTSKHHVDVFAVTKSVYLDEENVFRNGAWVLEKD